MIKILPITDCKECPKLINEKDFKGCELSNIQCYEIDIEDDWMDYLEQFCPLIFLEEVIEESYNLGTQYSDHKKEYMKQVRKSVRNDKWLSANDFFNTINEEKS